MEVVGIVAMTRTGLFEGEPGGAVYVPLAQEFSSNVFFHVRPARPDPALVDAVRREIRATAPGMPLFGVRTFATHVEAAAEYWMLRLSTLLFAFFGVMAMVVALVGIYGVTSYSVARRTREIGVRMAVGARPEAVLQMIMSESLGTAVGGVERRLAAGAGRWPRDVQRLRRRGRVRALDLRARARRLRSRRPGRRVGPCPPRDANQPDDRTPHRVDHQIHKITRLACLIAAGRRRA